MQQYYCPQCYGKSMVTVRLEKNGEDYICTQDQTHVYYIDGSGFPRRKK